MGDAATTPPSLNFQITNSGTGTVQWKATAGNLAGPAPFALTLAAASGSGTSVTGSAPQGAPPPPQTVTVTFDSVPAVSGTYTADIVVQPISGANNTATVSVTLTVNAGRPRISVAGAVAFTTNRTDTPLAQSFTVSNAPGRRALTWHVEDIPAWLSLSIAGVPLAVGQEVTLAGGAQAVVTVALVNHGGLSKQLHEATLTIVSNSDDDPLSEAYVDVDLLITAPIATIDVTSIVFATLLQGATADVPVVIGNSGDGPLLIKPVATLAIVTTDGGTWLTTPLVGGAAIPAGGFTVAPGGSTTLVVRATVGASQAPNAYQGTITLTDPDAFAHPAPIAVSMTVDAASGVIALQSPAGATLPTPLTADAIKGIDAIVSRQIQVAAAAGSFSYTVTESLPWLTIQAGQETGSASAGTPGTVTFEFTVGTLNPGEYTGDVLISGGAGTQPVTLPVKFIVKGGTFALASTDTRATCATTESCAVNVTAARTKDPAANTVEVRVSNTGGASLAVVPTITYTQGTGGWLSHTGFAASVAGASHTIGTLQITSTALAAGQYKADVTFADPNASNTATVSVTLVVAPAPEIGLSATTLSVISNPLTGTPSLSVTVSNLGDAPLTAVLTKSPWLDGVPIGMNLAAAAALPGVGGEHVINFTVNAASPLLLNGPNQGFITITDPTAVVPERTILINVTKIAKAAVSLSPAALAFDTKRNVNPAPKPLVLSNPGGVPLVYEVSTQTSDGGSWLAVSPLTGTVAPDGSVTLNVAPAVGSLAAGSYSGIITVTDPLSSNVSQQVQVTLLVRPGALALAPSPLLMSGTRWTECNAVHSGTNPAARALTLTNTGTGVLFYLAAVTTSNGGPWLALDRHFGVVAPNKTATISVSTLTKGLALGAYAGDVTIKALTLPAGNPHALVTETDTVPVILQVTEAPATLCVTPKSLDFGTISTSLTSAPKTVTLRNVGDSGPLTWSATATASRGAVVLSAAGGAAPDDLLVSIATTNKEGTQSGKITIASPGLPTQTVAVSWKVKKPKNSSHNHHGGDCDDDHDHDNDGDHDSHDHDHHHGRR